MKVELLEEMGIAGVKCAKGTTIDITKAIFDEIKALDKEAGREFRLKEVKSTAKKKTTKKK